MSRSTRPCVARLARMVADLNPGDGSASLLLELDHTKLRHIAPEVEAIDRSLVPVQVTNDDLLAPLMSAMCEEVRKGCPSGRLFGESISLALRHPWNTMLLPSP